MTARTAAHRSRALPIDSRGGGTARRRLARLGACRLLLWFRRVCRVVPRPDFIGSTDQILLFELSEVLILGNLGPGLPSLPDREVGQLDIVDHLGLAEIGV